MKWCDLYSGLTIRKQEDQPDCDIPDYFNRMASEATFALSPFHCVEDEEGSLVKVLWAPQDAMVKIHSVQVEQADLKYYDCLDLTMVVQFGGVLPPGFKYGTHVLKLEMSKNFNELPDDLFEDLSLIHI